MSVYGWYMWSRKNDEPPLKITTNNTKGWIITMGIFVASVMLIIFLLKHFKADDAEYWSTNIPYIDTFTTAIFIVGMWLMALKRIENWIFWIVGDIISIPLYVYKGLVFTGFQFIVFLIIAVMGYVAWRKKLLALS
jgi:nicotinamide mononucleotide transporter